MSTTQKPVALRLVDKYEIEGFLGDHRFAQELWCRLAATELLRQHACIAELEAQLSGSEDRVAKLEAARIAYASEFEPDADGDPDVGNIHANIRALKAQLSAIGAGGVEPLRKAAAGELATLQAGTYAEARECEHCNHVGINDSAEGVATCVACQWIGDSPKEDKCPDCEAEGTMTASCPKCHHEYRLIADATLAAAPAADAPMVDMTPPATSRDRWMYEQGRLAERDARTHGSVAAQAKNGE